MTARLRDISAPGSTGRGAVREAMPKVASRPNGASAASEASNVGPADHLEHDVDLAPAVGGLEGRLEVGLAGVDRHVGAELLRERALVGAGRHADDAAGAPGLGQLHGQRADAAGRGVHDDRLARLQVRAGAQQVPGRQALHEQRQRGARRETPSGTSNTAAGCDERLLGVPAAHREAGHPAAVRQRAGDLGPGHERQRRPGQVAVLDLVGVGVVDARARRREQLEPAARHGVGQVDEGAGPRARRTR